MNLLLEDLLTSLDKETDLYQDLLQLLQKEKRALVDLSLDDLNECNKEKETLILQARALEESRQYGLRKLAEFLDIPSDKLTLSYLSDRIDEPYSKEVKSRRSNLLSLFHSIKDINKTNESLMNHSLDCVTGSLSLLGNLVSTGSTYLHTGRLEHRTPEFVRGRV
ncbi:MAG: flagellar protein FlgN [Thermodesulfobacteriota bacterium]|nr:flagellar protein FlgN [Thermodesulfobacteriota bacterium]